MKKTSMEEAAGSTLIQREEIRVLYHGGYLKGRGLEELIKSVVYWDKNINLYFRGYGPIEEYLRRQVSSLSLENRVIFLEPVPMERLIADAAFADIGIIPYKPTCLNNYYSMPNKLFEYMMAGLAVAASDLPEIRRLNEEVGFGLLFNPDSPETIAGSINNLARDKDFLQACRGNARTWSGTAGNWETESGKLVDFYRDIFSSNQQKVCRGEINEK
ncbi:MAG: putative glycosyl transferase [Pelotomaculum sp. PtaB.Bin013]|nr:MAG: putative glycosyl transferase [Pelotomaculum sp. PtaB.Bin013]